MPKPSKTTPSDKNMVMGNTARDARAARTGATATLPFFITAGEGSFTIWTALVCDISIDWIILRKRN